MDTTPLGTSIRLCDGPDHLGNAELRIKAALDLALRYGGHDGAHHKDWVIDQMVRLLAAGDYPRLVAEAGPWDEGIAP